MVKNCSNDYATLHIRRIGECRLCGIFRYVKCSSYHFEYFLIQFAQLYLIALLIAMGILKAYDIPIYTANDNLYGICLLIFMYGLAMIPMVHLAEKLFYDASMANMYILCLNIVISFTTVITIVLFDVLGESEVSDGKFEVTGQNSFRILGSDGRGKITSGTVEFLVIKQNGSFLSFCL